MTDPREAGRTHRLPAVAAWLLVPALVLATAGCDATSSSPGPTAPAASAAPSETVASSEPLPTDEPATEPDETPGDTGSAGTPACSVDGLKASHGIMEVDADDRTTELVIVAADTCSIDAYPTLVLEDAGGQVLAAANALGAGGLDLVPGVAYTSEVRLSNWCLDEPAWPLRIGVEQDGGRVVATGDSFPDEGALPPCVHEDAGPVLAGTAWEPTP